MSRAGRPKGSKRAGGNWLLLYQFPVGALQAVLLRTTITEGFAALESFYWPLCKYKMAHELNGRVTLRKFNRLGRFWGIARAGIERTDWKRAVGGFLVLRASCMGCSRPGFTRLMKGAGFSPSMTKTSDKDKPDSQATVWMLIRHLQSLLSPSNLLFPPGVHAPSHKSQPCSWNGPRHWQSSAHLAV